MQEPAQDLQPLSFPLHGSRLIEASAGTGKTWTIATLYLRLILGHGGELAFAPQGQPQPLLPADILVMTFTRAATRELSERIRQRLMEAVACFRGEAQGDDFLQNLLADYPEPAQRQAAAWRLATAAEGMDDAAIYTIDAWCQRVLREHALDSGCLLDETLEVDEAQRLQEAVHDYWRQQCYPLSGELLAQVQAQWKNLPALLADMQKIARLPWDEALGEGELAQLLPQWQQERQAQLQTLAQGWEQSAQDYLVWIEGELAHNKTSKTWDGRKLQLGRCTQWLQALQDWALAPDTNLAEAMATGAFRLTPAGLDEAYKGGAAINLPPQAEALEQLLHKLATLPSPSTALRQHAAVRVRQRLQWLKAQAASFSFDDMLQRLDAALAGEQGAVLRQRLLQQYPVAMLDEFQDTSPLQYRLFAQIYQPQDNRPDSALLLIGDPKQSIYGFRGADIYSYLQAKQATAGRHYALGVNYRSTQSLVAAVNAWFAEAEERPGAGAFRFRTAGQHGDNPLPFVPVHAQGRQERLCHQGHNAELPTLQLHWLASEEPLSADSQRQQLAQHCAEQITQWLNDPSLGFEEDSVFQRLRPSDIAILVRTGTEADAVRRQLQRRGVKSVYLSDRESVFSSLEAQDLLFWLQAVAEPLNTRAVRAALATRLLDLSLPELQALVTNDELFDERTAQLHELHHIWQRQGVLAMLRASLHRFNLPARWLAQPGGERRLTNVLHLGELLQNASAQLEGEQALLRWLTNALNNPSQDADAQTLRLESDADLVQVVTIHKSKGLEYPIVMLPFASDFKPLERHRLGYIQTPEKEVLLDFDEQQLQQADEERLREDLRLFYVALTRPRHLLWLGMAALRKGNGKSTLNHRTASGYLLAGDLEQAPQSWQQTAQDFVAHQSSMAWESSRADAPSTFTPLAAAQNLPSLIPPPIYNSEFDRSWSVASFSAIARGLAASPEQALLAQRPADDEPDASAPTHPRIHASAPVWHRFKRGPLVGNFLHDQLQWLAQAGFDAQSPQQQERLLRRCERAGYGEQASEVQQWLAAITTHPLHPVHLPDSNLQTLELLLPEMEFWLPLSNLHTQALDTLCQQYLLPGQPRPPLTARALHGMLMGFADLVFAQDGRYWVLDYKSNHLGADASSYTPPTLAQAMLAHRYDVQAALYSLALHQLLSQRLGSAYHPEQHLGGALYFFIRGLDGSAVQHLPMPLEFLQGLQALLGVLEVAA